VSVAIGGDPMLAHAVGKGGFDDDPLAAGGGYPPVGYTTANGQLRLGASIVLVWQLGTPRTPSSTPGSLVLTHQLAYKLGSWNEYTIDVTKALAEVPAADRPSADEVTTQLRLVAAARGGTADVFFDDYHLDASHPTSTASEFVRRNKEIPRYDTPGFKLFPALEAGLNRHANRFSYDITKPSEYELYKTGIASIRQTEEEGYPAQLNHPALPGGVTEQEAISTDAEHADLVEAVPRGNNEVMLGIWDKILEKGVQVLGTWTSDAHRPTKLGPATHLYASALALNPLMRALYEGRAFMAASNFPGTVALNLDPQSSRPYPARYPVFVDRSQQIEFVHLRITRGVPHGARVDWIVNGKPAGTDSSDGPSLDLLHMVPLSGPFTYVRAELRDAHGALVAMTEPIFFRRTALAPGMSAAATGVANPGGRFYTRLATNGVGTPAWSAPKRTLDLPLPDRQGAIVSLQLTTGAFRPVGYAGASVVGHTWDAGSRVLDVSARVRRPGDTLTVRFAAAPMTLPPPPTGLSTGAVGATDVQLKWAARGAVGAAVATLITRDGKPIGVVPADLGTFVDATAQPATTYSYALVTVGADGRMSPSGTALTVTTKHVMTFSFTPSADTYVDQRKPATIFGADQELRVAASPVATSFLVFDVSGLQGTIRSAKLELYTTRGGPGYDVRSSAPGWSEASATYDSPPATGAEVLGSSGPLKPGAVGTVDVTSLVTGDGQVAVALTAASGGVQLASRESANPPKLIVETEG
jgi:hypothetical protein